MSSRLKEKVTAAIRKFNKSRSRSGSGDKKAEAGGGATSGNSSGGNVGGNATAKNSSGNAMGAGVAAESPGRRLRRQDNKYISIASFLLYFLQSDICFFQSFTSYK